MITETENIKIPDLLPENYLKTAEEIAKPRSCQKPVGKRPPEKPDPMEECRHLTFIYHKLTEEEYLEKFFRISVRRKDHLAIRTLRLIQIEVSEE